MDMMKDLPFHSQQEYIQIKRDIEELKANWSKNKRAVSTMESYQAEDVLSFMARNQEEVRKYLNKEKKSFTLSSANNNTAKHNNNNKIPNEQQQQNQQQSQ